MPQPTQMHCGLLVTITLCFFVSKIPARMPHLFRALVQTRPQSYATSFCYIGSLLLVCHIGSCASRRGFCGGCRSSILIKLSLDDCSCLAQVMVARLIPELPAFRLDHIQQRWRDCIRINPYSLCKALMDLTTGCEPTTHNGAEKISHLCSRNGHQ
jgi:hypothetical protein